MTTLAYPIISADSHITEPGHAYVDYIDPKWRDVAPRMIRDELSGDCFEVDGFARHINLGTACGRWETTKRDKTSGRKVR